jgi:fucose permease
MATKKNKTQEVENTASSNGNAALPFGKGNYMFMLIGIATILVGFLIMTMDKEEFGFGFLGLTLGPIIVFLGFMIELYAVLKKKA